MKRILEYLKKYNVNTPIYIDEVYLALNNELNIQRKVFNVYITRIEKRGIIKRFKRGVYYIPIETPFGMSKLNNRELVFNHYVMNSKETLGFITGPTFLNKIGVTTQEPNLTYIASKAVKNNRRDLKNKIFLRKAPSVLNKDNARYFQLLNALEDLDKYNVDVNDAYQHLNEYVKQSDLRFEDILKFAKYYKGNALYKKIGRIAQEE